MRPGEEKKDPDGLPGRARPPVTRSDQLFGDSNELIIDHHGQEYRLRITNLGKLILTK